MTETTRSAGTRDLLILTAERLFAEHGLDAVSTRQIAREAGQANTGSVHYYFGSREALVEAILERRMSAVNGERLALIEAFHEAGREPDLREAVALYVRPLAGQIADDAAYVRFIAQAYASPEIDLGALAAGKWDQSLRAVARLLRERLPGLPPALLRARIAFMFRQVVYALADWERDRLAGRPGRPELPLGLYVENLIDMMSAALAAPASGVATRAANPG